MLKTIKWKNNSSLFIAAFSSIAATLIGVTVWSIRAANKNVEQAVNRLSSFYMEELVGKREVVLRDSLGKSFEQLNRLLFLLESKNIKDQASLRSILSDAQILCGADKLAVVDDEGTIYTAHSTFSDASRYSFLLHKITGPEIVASNLYGAKKQVVLAIPVNNVRLVDRKLTSCFIQIDIDLIAGSLAYEDRNSAGNTIVGLYNKNGDDLTTSSFGEIERGRNLLDYFRTSRLPYSQSTDRMEKDFREGKSGLVTITLDEDTKYVYYTPVHGTDWMLTVMVNDNTIADQLEYTTKAMLRRSIFQLISIALIIMAISLMIGSLNKKNSDMLRRQQELEEKARNEEALRLARDEAEKANRAKTEFLFNMSHDIRTPMNAIIGFAGIMEKETGRPEQLKVHLKKLQESSSYLLSIINNILDMARIESGKVELNMSAIDLEDNVLDMFVEDMRKKNLRFSSKMNIQHRYVYADKQKLHQITANLLSNAVKYTPENGSVSVQFDELPCDRPGYATYKLTVSDTGIGIGEEFRKHIFESFTRERTSTENHIIGTGLGMAIVKKLVDMQGGSISVESELGKGATFTVTISHRIAEAQESFIRDKASVDTGKDIFSGKRILLAEDNDINAEIAMAILEDTGACVERAEDGIVCVDMLSKSAPGYYDLILMDVQMPNMNGYEATKNIRSLQDKVKSGIPIIALTANAFEEDRKNAYEAGMNGHLAKPIDVKKLIVEIQSVFK